ncbi:hypothetical protein ACNQR9_25840 [Mycolicibacterium peregrinum]
MSDARKLMAKVVSKHRLQYDDWAVRDVDFYTCACGLKTPLGDGAHAEWWDAHLAAEIDKALGGLKPEYIARHESGGGTIHGTLVNAEIAMHSYVVRDPGVEDPGSGMLVGIETRWVSGWQAQP